jgi:hypothetical protein
MEHQLSSSITDTPARTYEALSPSHNQNKELQMLAGRFPGLQNDSDIDRIFHDETTRLVHVIGLDGRRDPITYRLGGQLDYEVEAKVAPRTGGERSYVGPFYIAGEIKQL